MQDAEQIKGPGDHRKFFDSEILSDVMIRYGETADSLTVIYGHKVVLSSLSQYFLAAFTGLFVEDREPEITLLEDDPVCMEHMFRFMYGFGLPEVNSKAGKGSGTSALENIMEDLALYTVADKYLVDSMQAAVATGVKVGLATYLGRASFNASQTQVTVDECVKYSMDISLGRKNCPLYKDVVEAFQAYVQPLLNREEEQKPHPDIFKALNKNPELGMSVFNQILENPLVAPTSGQVQQTLGISHDNYVDHTLRDHILRRL